VTDSLTSLSNAISAFGDRMGDTHLLPLAVALLLHLASLLVRSGVWCGILRAAFPARRVRFREAAAAYVTGAGANAVAPLRGGDLVRIYAVRRFVPGAPYATIISTLIAETVFGAAVVGTIAAATVAMGWLPPLVRLPDTKAFEFSFYANHYLLVAVASGVAVSGSVLAAEWVAHHLLALWRRIAQGFAILRSPGRFVRVVALPQLLDWALRVATAYALLAAFGLPSAVRYALLVVVIDSVSTALPFTPGGIGAQQGLLVFALGGAASAGQVLAFSVGAQAVILAFNLLLGLIGAFYLFGHLRLASLHREAGRWAEQAG
jgi:glycosyltransferase 2 family protein